LSLPGSLEAVLGQELTGKLGPLVLKVGFPQRNRVKLEVAPQNLKAAAIALRALGFDHLHMVTGTDYPKAGEIEVTYVIGTISKAEWRRTVVLLATRVPRGDPRVSSLIEVWPAAEYHEREQFEMLGITFEGHPDLRRLLLPEDWNDIPPLRKDFQLRKWHEVERAEHGLVLQEEEKEGS
jgi:NADH-quinone oxidoreductase subunit C